MPTQANPEPRPAPGIDDAGGNRPPLMRLRACVCFTLAESWHCSARFVSAPAPAAASSSLSESSGTSGTSRERRRRIRELVVVVVVVVLSKFGREAGDAGCECDGWRGGGGWRRKNAGFGLIVGVAPVSRTMSSCTPSSTPSAAFGATADRGGTTSSPNEDDEDCERRVLLVVA